MKKYSCLLYGLLFFAFVSCQKEDFLVEEISSNSINNSLIGNWYLEDVPFDTLKLKRGYTFKQDNSFESFEKVTNSSGDILGYRHRFIGKYEVKGDKLTLFYSQHYTYDYNKGEYEDIEDLKPAREADIPKSGTRDFRQDKNTLTLYFLPCGPNELCTTLTFMTLYKD